MKKKTWLAILIIIFVLTSILFCLLIKKDGESEKIIKVSYLPRHLSEAPLMVAYEKGFFEENGINVEIIPVSSSADSRSSVSFGKVDLAVSSPTNLFIPISKGLPVKIIAPMTLESKYLYVNPSSGIKTFDDLVGKRIRCEIGSGEDLFLRLALKKENLSSEDIIYSQIEHAYALVALMQNNSVGGSMINTGEIPTYEDAGAVVLEEWITHNHSDQMLRMVVGVNTDFFESHEDEVDKFIDSIIEAHRFMKENPDESAVILANHIKEVTDNAIVYTPEQIKEAFEKLTFVLWYDIDNLKPLAEITKEMGNIEKIPERDEMFDFRYEEKLRKAQSEIYQN